MKTYNMGITPIISTKFSQHSFYGRWRVIGEPPFWINWSATKSRRSPEQAKAYNDSGHVWPTAVQRHAVINYGTPCIDVRKSIIINHIHQLYIYTWKTNLIFNYNNTSLTVLPQVNGDKPFNVLFRTVIYKKLL